MHTDFCALLYLIKDIGLSHKPMWCLGLGLSPRKLLNHERQTVHGQVGHYLNCTEYPNTCFTSSSLTSLPILRYVNFDFGICSAMFAALAGFLRMEIKVIHWYGSVQNALFRCFRQQPIAFTIDGMVRLSPSYHHRPWIFYAWRLFSYSFSA